MKYYLYYTFKKDEPIKGYIGMTHYEINSGYKGSGKYLKSAFKKYGTNQFRRIDLCEFNNIDECYYWEGFYIKYYRTLVSQGGYNISPKGGLGINGCHSQETKLKISESNKGIHKGLGIPKSKEHNKKVSIALKDKPLSEYHKLKISKTLTGQHHSKEHCMNIGKSTKGKKYYVDKDGKRRREK